MALQSSTDVARNLIERHGLRAAAVAEEHVNEALQSGDTSALGHWRSVQLAVAELRTSARTSRAGSAD